MEAIAAPHDSIYQGRRGERLIPWILAVLGVFVLQTLIPPIVRYLFAGPGTGARLRIALGARDEQPPLSEVGRRAERALDNMHEALPVFLTLAVLHLVQRTPGDLPNAGAAVFLVARVIYLPAYMSGITGLRSAVWVVSWVGLIMMIAALF